MRQRWAESHLELTLSSAGDSIPKQSELTGQAGMKQRYLVIILLLLIGSGAYAHPVGAADCAPGATCMPIHSNGHSAGGHNSPCFCSLWSTPSGSACRLESFLELFQPAIAPPGSQNRVLSILGWPAVPWDRIPRLNRRGLLPRRLNKSDSPLSYPIYLSTLALLC